MKKVKLSHIISNLESGARPKGGSSADSGTVPSLGAEHLNSNGGFNLSKVKFISDEFFGSLKNGKIQKNDILIVKDGATTGKVSFVSATFPFEEAAVNEHVFRLALKDVAYPAYVFWFLHSKHGKHQILKDFRGATVGGISRNFADLVSIPLPSLSQQKRIAEILDKADSLRRKRQQAIDLSSQFLRSVFLDMFGDPVTNSKNWKVVNLGSLLESIESGWSPKCNSFRAKKGEWGVLKLGAVTYCEYKDFENKALNSKTNPRPELEVKNGDLLFTRKNTYDLVAASALVNETRPQLMLPDLIFRLNTISNELVQKPYLWALLTHPGKRKSIQKMASGAAGSMPNISKSKLKEVNVPLPPIHLQKKFTNIYEKNWELIDKINDSVQNFENLKKSLSQKAFSGNL